MHENKRSIYVVIEPRMPMYVGYLSMNSLGEPSQVIFASVTVDTKILARFNRRPN